MKKFNTKIFVISSLTAFVAFVILFYVLTGSLRAVLAERNARLATEEICNQDPAFDISDPLVTKSKDYVE